MATTRDIVEGAMRKAGVVPIGQSIPGEEFVVALTALNDMLHAWELEGVDVSHTTLAASDTFPLDDKFHEGTKYVLAGRLSADFEAPVGFDPDVWFRRVQAAYTTISAATMDAGLKDLPSQRFRRYF